VSAFWKGDTGMKWIQGAKVWRLSPSLEKGGGGEQGEGGKRGGGGRSLGWGQAVVGKGGHRCDVAKGRLFGARGARKPGGKRTSFSAGGKKGGEA